METEELEVTNSVEINNEETVAKSGLYLKLGDIIEIYSPNNSVYDQQTYFIDYINEKRVHMININNLKPEELNIDENRNITDESIEKIYILSSSEEEGFARQNGLIPYVWIDVHIGGELPTIITGQIINLEEDQIEIKTYPDLQTIFIDFEYKGIPENIPFTEFKIRSKPDLAPKDITNLDIEDIENNDINNNIPNKDDLPEENYVEVLNELYNKTDVYITFGEEETIEENVVIPEKERKYVLEAQLNDMLDVMLSTIPNSKRSQEVLDKINLLIDRFKQLRNKFSTFGDNQVVVGYRRLGNLYKPIIERIKRQDTSVKWLVPVVFQNKKLYNISDEIDETDFDKMDIIEDLQQTQNLYNNYTKKSQSDSINNYADYNNKLSEYIRPFSDSTIPEIENKTLSYKESVLTEMDVIIDNLGDFKSSCAFVLNEPTSYKIYGSPIGNVQNSDIRETRFVIERYSLGINKLEPKNTRKLKGINVRVQMTPNDKITIKSLIMMPEPVLKYSRINLPGTSILDRVSLHHNYLSLFRLFKKRTKVDNYVVNSFKEELNYDDETPFLNSIKEYVIDDKLEMEDDKLEKLLNVIIPNTRKVIHELTKKMNDKISFYEVVKQLEPFLVYTDDITYGQGQEIRYFLKNKILELKKSYMEKSDIYKKIRDDNTLNTPEYKSNKLINIISEQTKIVEIFKETYLKKAYFGNSIIGNTFIKGNKINMVSSSELLSYILHKDGIHLFSDLLSFISLKTLTNPKSIMNVFEPPTIDDMGEVEKIKPKDCIRRFLTKKYTSIKELQDDNGKEAVFYDKEYDDTPYNILDSYKNEKKTMNEKDFKEFLTATLVAKHGVPLEEAKEMTITLVVGKKLVRDGEYAILSIKPKLPPTVDETMLSDKEKEEIELEEKTREKTQYYRRIKNSWESDNDINSEEFIDTNTLFCNIKEKCNKNISTKVCEDSEFTRKRIEIMNKQRMVKEFENRVEKSFEELEAIISKTLKKDIKKLNGEDMIKEIRKYQANNYAYELGKMSVKQTIVESPYAKGLVAIKGIHDFVKRQNTIIKFYQLFCREPMVNELKEDPYWLYCKETNVKLLEQSVYLLAVAFIEGGEEGYRNKVNELCSTRGVLSEDGNVILDRFSGNELRKIDFVAEEGYDENGFRVITHAVIEDDLETKLTNILNPSTVITKKETILEGPENQLIFNVLKTIMEKMNIPLDLVLDFVLRKSKETMKLFIKTDVEYDELSKKILSKDPNAKVNTYEKYKNSNIMWIIASNIIIAIQTLVPSYIIKYSARGCKLSFKGYPLYGGVEDISAIEYISCVMFSLKSKEIKPWNSIALIKQNFYVDNIKKILEQIVQIEEIQNMFLKKKEYLLLHPDTDIPEELSIQKWTTFLPPVVPINLTGIMSITKDFEDNLLKMIRDGHKDQRKYIGIVQSKIIKYGYSIVELINKIVDTKDPLMKTMSKVPFLENSCCDDSNNNPIQYFIEKDPTIKNHINIAVNLSNLVNEIKQMSKASYLYNSDFTGIIYATTGGVIEEKNIYEAIIYYCNFDNELSIPVKLRSIYNTKPSKYDPKKDIYEKIGILKKYGNKYSGYDDLLNELNKLMTIVYNENLVTIKKPIEITQKQRIIDIIEDLNIMESEVCEGNFRKLLLEVVDEYRPNTMTIVEKDEDREQNAISKIRRLKDYLAGCTDRMYDSIIKFLQKYSKKSSNRDLNKYEDFIQNILKTKLNEKDSLYTTTKFIYNSIYSISKLIPNIIINENYFQEYEKLKKIPKQWGFSSIHKGILSEIITKKWKKYMEFDKENVLENLLKTVQENLNELIMLLKEIPIYSPLQKGGNMFFSLFDSETIEFLYKYFWYSTIYEYIKLANNEELSNIEVKEKKQKIREKKNDMNDIAGLTIGEDSVIDESYIDENNDLLEVEIQISNQESIKEIVASLLVCYLNEEIENKKLVLSYDEIMKKVRKLKIDEKEKIVDYLGKMTKDERKLEDEFKRYKIGQRWNRGLQSGLFKYDKKTFDMEIAETNDYEEGDLPVESSVEQLETEQQQEYQEEQDNEGYDIGHLGEDYQDGDFYGDYREDEKEFGDL